MADSSPLEVPPHYRLQLDLGNWSPKCDSVEVLNKAMGDFVEPQHVGTAVEVAMNAARRFVASTRLLEEAPRAVVAQRLEELESALESLRRGCSTLRGLSPFGLGLGIDVRTFVLLNQASGEFFDGPNELDFDRLSVWAAERLSVVQRAREEAFHRGAKEADPNDDLALSAGENWTWLKKHCGAKGSLRSFVKVVHGLLIANGFKPNSPSQLLEARKARGRRARGRTEPVVEQTAKK